MKEITPYKEHNIEVSDIHTIWVGEFGNPDGKVVFTFHGGPGSKSKPKHFAHVDTDKFRIIQIDQRGCGQSVPNGEIKENSTQDLIDDIELVRKKLDIEKAILNGGSWGSTIALLYAEKYPDVVRGMFLRGIFLVREEDTNWLLHENGASKIFPELWEKRLKYLEENNVESSQASSFLLDKLSNGSESEKKQAASNMSAWEGNILTLENNFNFMEEDEITEEDIAAAKIFAHYDTNNFFLKQNQILNNVKAIKDIPTVIIHGRYDMVCTVDQAFELNKNLNNSILEITNFDGHKLGKESKRLSKYLFKELINKIDANE